MRTVLFGDSNTWGLDPETGERFPRDVRWPGRLQPALADGCYVVEEGVNARTATLDSPVADGKNGLMPILVCPPQVGETIWDVLTRRDVRGDRPPVLGRRA